MTNRSTVRGAARAVAVVCALLLLPLADARAEGHGHDHADPYANCYDDHPAAAALRAAVTHQLTHVYNDVVVLTAMGYHPYFDIVIPGITHWLKPQFIDDGFVMDPTQPESILVDEWNRPVGVMFIEESTQEGPAVYTISDEESEAFPRKGNGECNPWHPHTDAPARFGWMWYRAMYDGSATDGSMEFPDETPSMMHVWVNNPNGTFNGHDYPESEGPPGPIPGYLRGGAVEETANTVFGNL